MGKFAAMLDIVQVPVLLHAQTPVQVMEIAVEGMIPNAGIRVNVPGPPVAVLIGLRA